MLRSAGRWLTKEVHRVRVFERDVVIRWIHVHVALAVVIAVGVAALVGVFAGVELARNNILGSHTNQLSRCTPQDTTHACAQGLTPPSGRVTAPPKPGDPPGGLPSGAQGLDFAWSCPDPNGVYGGHTVQWAFSYVSTDGSKNWSRNCINWWLNAGKHVGINWETTADRTTNGYDAGYSDALTARSQANYLLPGQGVPVFFSIDCDCSYGQVVSYFQGADAAIGKSRVGAYGGYYPVRDLFNNGVVAYGWQAYAWSYGQWEPRALLEQWLNGDAWDYDRTISGSYQGLYPFPPPVDPWRILDKTRFSLPFGQRASEYNSAKAFETAHCLNPVRRQVCKSSRWHLQLLRDRLVFVIHHRLTARGWVASKPDYRFNRGARLHRLEYDITTA